MRWGGIALGTAGLLALLLGGVWLLDRHQPVSTTLAPAAAPTRHPLPPWTVPQLRELLETVKQADQEGLHASTYDAGAIQAVVDAGRTGAEVDMLANRAALSLAHDYAAGRIRNRHRFNWYIDYAGPTPAEMTSQIVAAREQGRLGGWLQSLLPTSPQYRALRTALAATPAEDTERRDRIEANMERWRWLPRDFGQGDQLYVNLPTYQLDVIQGGHTVAAYKAVIGATDMPTPVLSAAVRQVIANPDWIVPQSIVRKSHLRPGASSRYIFTTRPDGTVRVRQKPGPGNALGRVKIQFPNPLAIYFHDTPSKSLFGSSDRTFSHGCVRVQNIEALAGSIVARPDRFSAALADTKTRSFTTARPWRANIVYLTLVPAANGALVDVGDPYHMDEALAAVLDGRKPRVPPPAPLMPVKQASTAQPKPNAEAKPSAEMKPEPEAEPQSENSIAPDDTAIGVANNSGE